MFLQPLTLSLATACLAVAITPTHATETSRPNVIVFLVDDMGLMDTSVPFLTDDQGQPKRYPLNDFYRTPNMEKLAASGIRFNNFYAMSVCSPTRTSIMTGQNAARHHTTQWISPETNNRGKFGPTDWNWKGLNRNSATLSRMMQTAGYRTIHVGKGHFGPFKTEGADPSNLGFDVNIAGRAIGAPGSYAGRENYGNGKRKGRDRAVPNLEKYHGTDTHLTEALTLEAKTEIAKAVNSDKPFFLYMAHYAVHGPHQSDPRFASHYVGPEHSQRVQNFATLIEGMDKSLGDLVSLVRELGVGENTLILFLGDNGTDAPIGHQHAVACAAPLRGKKGSHYEGGVRVPFIAAWADPSVESRFQQQLSIPADMIQSQMSNVCDLLPTIVQLCDIAVPDDHKIDGSSLTRLLQGEADLDHSSEFLMHFPHEHRSSYYTSFRRGDWKVIHHDFPGKDSDGERYQLFNLAVDPFEQTNLASKKPEVLQQMMRALIESLHDHSAQYAIHDSHPQPPLLPTDSLGEDK